MSLGLVSMNSINECKSWQGKTQADSEYLTLLLEYIGTIIIMMKCKFWPIIQYHQQVNNFAKEKERSHVKQFFESMTVFCSISKSSKKVLLKKVEFRQGLWLQVDKISAKMEHLRNLKGNGSVAYAYHQGKDDHVVVGIQDTLITCEHRGEITTTKF